MAHATITARINSDDKRAFDIFCDDVGLTASGAINLFVKAVLRRNKIPFEIDREQEDPFYSEANMKHLLRSIKQLDEGKGIEHELSEA